jgi:DNA-binding CsgD family transcriptional regulator
MSPASKRTLTSRSFGVVSRIAAVAASGAPVEERVEEILDQLELIFPFDAGMVARLDPSNLERRPVVVRGYAAPFLEYMTTKAWHSEVVEPFGLPSRGWPVRDRDLPVDPSTLPGLAYGREAGLHEGLLSALVTRDGHFVGFLILSWSRLEPPPDEVCVVVGGIAPALANIVDPMQSARALTSTLGDVSFAAGFAADGSVVPLCGHATEDHLEESATVRHMVDHVLQRNRSSVSFLWPKAGGDWYSCHAYRCRDQIAVLTVNDRDHVHGLTRREVEVLTKLVEGGSNSDIAGEIGVTTRTVRAHVEHILVKLSVTTRAAAAARAVAEGLVLPTAPPTVLD